MRMDKSLFVAELEDDELIVEGSISDAYYNVRDALYAQYQIL